MKNKYKNIVITISFMMMITGLMLTNVVIPDKNLSHSERRRLKSMPNLSIKTLLDGQFFEDLESYFLDQFVMRDEFRCLKAISRLYLLNQLDHNDVYIVKNGVYKIEYPLKENSIRHAAYKLNDIYNQYLSGMNVYYSVIPDKNYFVAEKNGYLSMDYELMKDILHTNVENMTYINLFDSLSITDYYRTDIHWRQDKILHVAKKIIKQMNLDDENSDVSYTEKKLYPFYGSYYGQSALPIQPDTITYLTNDMIEKAILYDYESKSYGDVYNPELFDSLDAYSLFLSGPKSLISIENPESTSNKELVLFRDSFGSSIAPLLLEGYAKIYLVDLRYIATDLLGDYIHFRKNQDVLFLYSTEILNNSMMLK